MKTSQLQINNAAHCYLHKNIYNNTELFTRHMFMQ